MMLTSDEIEKIAVELINAVPPVILGVEADALRIKLTEDIALAKKKGWIIDRD